MMFTKKDRLLDAYERSVYIIDALNVCKKFIKTRLLKYLKDNNSKGIFVCETLISLSE